ncbi:unnamed protein product, partial [Amoebophrya sp. A25]
PEQCAVFKAPVVANTRVVFELENCKFFSGPLYHVYAYVETPFDEIPNPEPGVVQSSDGTMAAPVSFYVPLSNEYRIAPKIDPTTVT